LQPNNLLHIIDGEGIGAIFNSLTTYQILQPIEEEAVITVAQTDVEEVNRSTSDGT
jgi:hypothetical protein